MDGLRLIYIITGEVYMQHGTKNGYVGILFWLEPGAKITCNMVGFFWDRRSHSLLCRTIHALGLYRIHSSVKAKAGLGLGLELPVGERFYVVVCFFSNRAFTAPVPGSSIHRYRARKRRSAARFYN